MDALRLLRAMMALAISCDQDISVDDGSRGKKASGFCWRMLRNGELRALGNVCRGLLEIQRVAGGGLACCSSW